MSNFNPIVDKFRKIKLRKINYSEIARQLGVTPQHVRRVALGETTSKRVLRRLEKEWLRKEREERKLDSEKAA